MKKFLLVYLAISVLSATDRELEDSLNGLAKAMNFQFETIFKKITSLENRLSTFETRKPETKEVATQTLLIPDTKEIVDYDIALTKAIEIFTGLKKLQHETTALTERTLASLGAEHCTHKLHGLHCFIKNKRWANYINFHNILDECMSPDYTRVFMGRCVSYNEIRNYDKFLYKEHFYIVPQDRQTASSLIYNPYENIGILFMSLNKFLTDDVWSEFKEGTHELLALYTNGRKEIADNNNCFIKKYDIYSSHIKGN